MTKSSVTESTPGRNGTTSLGRIIICCTALRSRYHSSSFLQGRGSALCTSAALQTTGKKTWECNGQVCSRPSYQCKIRCKTDPVRACVHTCLHVCLCECACVYLCVQVCVYVYIIYICTYKLYTVCMWAGVCLWIINASNKYNILQMYNAHYKLIYPGWFIMKQVMKKTKS